MFAFEKDGYRKEEVDSYIAKLKTELMEKKLSLLDSEQKVLALKQNKEDIDSKEKNIIKALKTLEEAQKVQEEGSKNLYALRNEQNVLLRNKVESLINQIDARHPEIRGDKLVKDIILELQGIINNEKESNTSRIVNTDNDSMRILLNKMQEYKKQKDESKIVKIERNNIKSLCNNSKNVDEFLSTQPESDKLYKGIELQSNGFDLKEAVNPKDDLDEIMKAFDFFNDNGEK